MCPEKVPTRNDRHEHHEKEGGGNCKLHRRYPALLVFHVVVSHNVYNARHIHSSVHVTHLDSWRQCKIERRTGTSCGACNVEDAGLKGIVLYFHLHVTWTNDTLSRECNQNVLQGVGHVQSWHNRYLWLAIWLVARATGNIATNHQPRCSSLSIQSYCRI